MLFSLDSLIALATLSAMEIVLGIDNIVFIAVLVSKLPAEVQDKARRIGISLAFIMRIALLFSITWLMGLTNPIFHLLRKGFSGRDLILLAGGLFLIAKATYEIHDKLEAEPHELDLEKKRSLKLRNALIQIILLDLVFSLDSVITAVGMAQQVVIMVLAMIIAMFVMLISSGKINSFVHRHPTLKILALSFLLLIGVMLFLDGMGIHVPKGYIYFAMTFSLMVESLNIRYRKRHTPH